MTQYNITVEIHLNAGTHPLEKFEFCESKMNEA